MLTQCVASDGEHEYNHTVTGNHSVEVVGYAESGVRDGAGSTTQFVVGECVDVLLRVRTKTDGGRMTWSLDDDGHNGPWFFDVPGGTGVQEFESCMYNNEYTLTRQGGSGWQGSVEVVGFLHYHNTIEIPPDESWIVQGTVDPATGVPVSLDGRLSSGDPLAPSRANIVLRDIRFTGQVAPVDLHGEWRDLAIFTVPNQGLGGAFHYTGGSDDPSQLARLIFERVVFDHNAATSGSAVFLHGRAGWPVPATPDRQNWQSGVSWTTTDCTYFRNWAVMMGASLVADVWPHEFTFDGTTFAHNQAAFLGADDGYGFLAYPGPERRSGYSSLVHKNAHYDGGNSAGVAWGIMPSNYMALDPNDDPDAVHNVTYDGSTLVDHNAVLWGMVQSWGTWPPQADQAKRWSIHLIDYNLANNPSFASGDTYDSAFTADFGGNNLVERTRFENNGANALADDVVAPQGTGGWCIYRGYSALPDRHPRISFVNSEWIGNHGGNG